jgi:hypothetical protein
VQHGGRSRCRLSWGAASCHRPSPRRSFTWTCTHHESGRYKIRWRANGSVCCFSASSKAPGWFGCRVETPASLHSRLSSAPSALRGAPLAPLTRNQPSPCRKPQRDPTRSKRALFRNAPEHNVRRRLVRLERDGVGNQIAVVRLIGQHTRRHHHRHLYHPRQHQALLAPHVTLSSRETTRSSPGRGKA